ncbi:imidazolonepropionase [Hwanghaeella sp.]|uniref:imidazolonepropionase n=1 Tax=Hwanghaeella sp. TaxID=2605943 RepID=UPI003CCBC3E8
MVPGGARYGAVADGAVAVDDGRIVWIGAASDLPKQPAELARRVEDGGGGWMTPGLIDCHTHIVHGGSRAGEFEMRLEGASYEEIARAGGGILSTVKATRAASEQELLASAMRRARRLLAEGVTVLEVKSGYGLDLDTELKMLRVARRLERELPVTVRTTFLGAHALPPDYKDRADAYIDFVCAEVLPAVAAEGLADAVDAFCEGIGFSPVQTARVFDTAAGLGLPVKLHADQLSDLGGAALAAGYSALSADHLEYTSDAGIAAMAEAGTVAVLLPGAFYFLREKTLPPLDGFRRHGVPIALATDNNPGSSPAVSLLLILNMACTLFRMTPEEALAGVTRNGAAALGLGEEYGTLEVGKRADFVLWDVETPADLSYRMGDNPCKQVVRHGKTVPTV